MRKILCSALLVLLVILTGCKNNSLNRQNLKDLGIDISDGTIKQSIDTHGGMGDGSTYIEIEFSDEKAKDMEQGMKENEKWKLLPLTDNLQTAVYGNKSRESLITCFDEEIPAIPDIGKGYYYFYDRHYESKDHFDDTNLFGRYSFNFDVIIYDLGKHKLYLYQLDT